MKNVVVAVLISLASCSAWAASVKELRFRAAARAEVERGLESGDLPRVVVDAVDAIVARGNGRLRAEGHGDVADELDWEWWKIHRPRFLMASVAKDMGDHAPMPSLAWLADWYAKVEAKLGVTVCELLHLRDIFVIVYGWPVVKAPHQESQWCAEALVKHPYDVCQQEWLRHFAGTKWLGGVDIYSDSVKHWGVASVAAYWTALVACEAALWGADGTFVCRPAATAVEIAVSRYVAPRLGRRVWDRNNTAN